MSAYQVSFFWTDTDLKDVRFKKDEKTFSLFLKNCMKTYSNYSSFIY